MKLVFHVFIGILNEVLGEALDLSADEICKFSSIIQKNGMVLHKCDPEERPLAIITEEGKWEHETDNSQGSLRIRFVIFITAAILQCHQRSLGVNTKNLREVSSLNLFLKNLAQKSGHKSKTLIQG